MADKKSEDEGFTVVVKRVLSTSKVQISFLVAIVATFAGLIPFTQRVSNYIQRVKTSAPLDYKFPELSDLKYSVVFTIIFLITHTLWIKVVPPMMEPYVKTVPDEKERKKKAKKIALKLYSSFVYTISLAWGYSILKDTDFLPRSLGGTGDLQNTLKDYPYQKQMPNVDMYYMFMLGWHVEAFLKMVLIDSIGPNIVEMSLHHLVTAYLVAGSYLVNQVNMGAMIGCYHDATDILVGFARAAVDSKFKKVSYATMVMCLSAWFYVRLYIFSGIIYYFYSYEAIYQEQPGDKYIQTYFTYGLSLIYMLNAWWAYCMFMIAFRAITKNDFTDTQSDFIKKDKVEDKKEKIKK